MPPIRIENDLWLTAALEGDTAFLIWGWAEYMEIFSNIVRRTEFAFRVRAEGTAPSSAVIRFEATQQHNAADEDCMHPPQSRF